MSDRAKAAERVALVRRQMAELAEWRRLAAENRLAAVRADRRDLERFVAETQPVGTMAAAVLSQSQRLSRRESLASALRDRHASDQIAAKRLQKTAETLADRLGRDHRERSERRELERLIEAFAGSDDPTSLP